MTDSERADIVRSLLSHRGWTQMQDPICRDKMEHAKDAMLLDPSDRTPEYKTWSIDKFAGFVVGLGWSRRVLDKWLQRYDEEQRLAEQALPNGNAPHGHPYAPPVDEPVS